MVSDAQPETTLSQQAELLDLFKEYCAGMESLAPAAVQRIYPGINTATLENQFRLYKRLTCTVTRAPEFIQVDAIGGTARVELNLKQTIEYKRGGPEFSLETIVDATLSRESATSRWQIDGTTHRPLK